MGQIPYYAGKDFFQSRVTIGLLVGLLAMLLRYFGYDIIDPEVVTTTVLRIVELSMELFSLITIVVGNIGRSTRITSIGGYRIRN